MTSGKGKHKSNFKLKRLVYCGFPKNKTVCIRKTGSAEIGNYETSIFRSHFIFIFIAMSSTICNSWCNNLRIKKMSYAGNEFDFEEKLNS